VSGQPRPSTIPPARNVDLPSGPPREGGGGGEENFPALAGRRYGPSRKDRDVLCPPQVPTSKG